MPATRLIPGLSSMDVWLAPWMPPGIKRVAGILPAGLVVDFV